MFFYITQGKSLKDLMILLKRI